MCFVHFLTSIRFFVCFSAFQDLPRAFASDILPAIRVVTAEIFIKKVDESIHWDIFMDPLSTNTWLILVIIAIVISCTLSFIDRLFEETGCQRFYPLIFFENLWLSIKANFGGKSNKIQRTNAHKVVIFDCLLMGTLIWIYYRASFISRLSIAQLKFPFQDLESLSKSDYK